MGELKPCGTAAAHRRHQRKGEEPCAACKKAWADEHRAYLARADEKVIAHKRAWSRAYGRALRRLAAAHPDEMAALMADEIEAGQ